MSAMQVCSFSMGVRSSCVETYMYIYISIYVDMYICIYVYMYICICVYIYILYFTIATSFARLDSQWVELV